MKSEIYDEFLQENTVKVNKYLNIALWIFALAGPALAIGVWAGVFRSITYLTCVIVTAAVLVLAIVHFLLLKKNPGSLVNGVFALTVLDALLVFMVYSHVNIELTWFLVPVLSLLFSNKKIYIYSVVLNYVCMGAAVWMTAPYYAAVRMDFTSPMHYFGTIMGGFTIETIILIAATVLVRRRSNDHLRYLMDQRNVINEKEMAMEEKMDILNSMSDIYDNVNLLDFIDNTEMSLRNSNEKKYYMDLPVQTQTHMNQLINARVLPEQLEDFKTFTNITTVRARLTNKKIISADFIDVEEGWFRAQYITVDATADGIPTRMIYTTRNVDDDKRREQHLIRISLTDEMTRLYNRRCYEEDLDRYREGKPLEGDLVLFSLDVNGLKKANDTLGHNAGDELIKGAADCLTFAVGTHGKSYRTGGDEFMAIVHTTDAEAIREEIQKKAKEWHGVYSDTLEVSVGYASHQAHPKSTVDELEHLADTDMYAEKEKYYKERQHDRRRR